MPALTLRELTRATLARQGLLERFGGGVVDAVRRCGGLQAQEARPAALGLWTRTAGFSLDELRAALHGRELVRGPLHRATLHLVTAEDYAATRLALQPALDRGMSSLRGRDAGLDVAATVARARQELAGGPLGFDALRDRLARAFPQVDERALGYATRLHLPLVMVPGDDRWGFPPSAAFTPADDWLAAPLPAAGPEEVVRRHLAAFGPATPADVQAWSGLGALTRVMAAMDDLEVLRGPDGKALYDLPGAPRPGEDVAAPPRLLPEFDALVLAHRDRSRVVPDAHRRRIVTANLRVRATFLVDGLVAGTWAVARARGRATLTLTPFGRLPRGARKPLDAEAEALLAFAEPEAKGRAVAWG